MACGRATAAAWAVWTAWAGLALWRSRARARRAARRRRVALLDGGLGSELERRGADLRRERLWSARLLQDEPALLVAVHAQYIAAGADVVSTATYQFSFAPWLARGLSRRDAGALLRRGVALADQARRQAPPAAAAGRARQVAATLGSYGAIMGNGAEFTGDFDIGPRELQAFHAERLEHLLGDDAETAHGAVRPDWIAFETVPSLAEVRAICAAVAAHPLLGARPRRADAPRVWLSLSCGLHGADCLNSGEPVLEAVLAARDAGVLELVGFNCTAPALIAGLVRLVEPHLGPLGLVLYPNKGETYGGADGQWKGEPASDDDFAAMAASWAELSDKVRLIGGCCKTTPETMAKVAAALRAP
jgi:homocysteine S-methyltransferase